MSLLLGTTVILRGETMCRSQEPEADRIFCLMSVWLCDGSINKNLKPHPFPWDHYGSILTSTIRIQIYSHLLDHATDSNQSSSFSVFLHKTGRSHFFKKKSHQKVLFHRYFLNTQYIPDTIKNKTQRMLLDKRKTLCHSKERLIGNKDIEK